MVRSLPCAGTPTHNDNDRIPSGTQGTVDGVDDASTIHVNWDNGLRFGPGPRIRHLQGGRLMPKQIGKDTTPDEILLMAQEYQQLLAKSNVPMKVEQTIADMERRAAEMNGLTGATGVDDWKATFEAGPPAAAAAAPKPTLKKPAARRSPTSTRTTSTSIRRTRPRQRPGSKLGAEMRDEPAHHRAVGLRQDGAGPASRSASSSCRSTRSTARRSRRRTSGSATRSWSRPSTARRPTTSSRCC